MRVHNPNVRLGDTKRSRIYMLSFYALKALKRKDFELRKQAFPKAFTKYINIMEGIIVS